MNDTLLLAQLIKNGELIKASKLYAHFFEYTIDSEDSSEEYYITVISLNDNEYATVQELISGQLPSINCFVYDSDKYYHIITYANESYIYFADYDNGVAQTSYFYFIPSEGEDEEGNPNVHVNIVRGETTVGTAYQSQHVVLPLFGNLHIEEK